MGGAGLRLSLGLELHLGVDLVLGWTQLTCGSPPQTHLLLASQLCWDRKTDTMGAAHRMESGQVSL